MYEWIWNSMADPRQTHIKSYDNACMLGMVCSVGMCVPRHCCHGCTMVVLVFVRGRMPRLILYEVMYGCVGNGLGCRLPWLCCFMSITLLMLCWMI